MTEIKADGIPGRVVWWFVLATVLAQRLVIVVFYEGDLARYIADQGGLLLFHYLPLEVLRDQPLEGLRYLQQSPPLPSILMTGAIQLLRWPDQVTYFLIGLNALLDAVAAALLADLIGRVWRRPWLGLALGVVFGLGPDLVVLDYNARGQSFYENLTMVLVLLACRLGWRLLEKDGVAPAAWLGVVAGAAALTRASYSFFSLALLLMLAVLPIAQKRARLIAFVCLAFALQGAWVLKNAWVYGDLRWTTSTWGGGNLTAGLVNLGYGKELAQVVEGGDYPPFVVDLVRKRPDWVFLYPAAESPLLPPDIAAEDAAIDAALGGHNLFQNQVAQRMALDEMARAWRTLILAHPTILLRKLKWSYKLYWFPIRYHTSQYIHISPFESTWSLEPSLLPWVNVGAWWRGEAPEQVWMVQTVRPLLQRREVALPTLDWLNLAAWQINYWLLHLAALPWAALLLWRRFGWRASGRPWTLVESFHLLLAGVFVYAALVHNLVEFGENMRFRLNVEPVIWLLSFSGGLLAWRFLRERRGRPEFA